MTYPPTTHTFETLPIKEFDKPEITLQDRGGVLLMAVWNFNPKERGEERYFFLDRATARKMAASLLKFAEDGEL